MGEVFWTKEKLLNKNESEVRTYVGVEVKTNLKIYRQFFFLEWRNFSSHCRPRHKEDGGPFY